jgi:hypothetical protein
MGSTETIIRTYFAQTIGEVDFLEQSIKDGRFDLSDQGSLEFVGRLLVGQVRALYYLAGQIDDLKASARGGQ